MKKNNSVSFVLCLVMMVLFASCSSTRYGAHFQSSPQKTYANKSDQEVKAPEKTSAEESALVLKETIREDVQRATRRSGSVEASTDALPDQVPSIKELTSMKDVPLNTEINERQQKMINEVEERLKNMSRKERRALKKEVKNIDLREYTKNLPEFRNMEVEDLQQREDLDVVALILAIFIPPLGVFIHEGVTNKFWISLVLTILGLGGIAFISALGLLPAIVYSVLVVLDLI